MLPASLLPAVLLVAGGCGRANLPASSLLHPTTHPVTPSPDRNSASPSAASTATGRRPAPASVVDAVTQLPESTLAAVGNGSVRDPLTSISGGPLTAGGRPEVFWLGAEYCPYCAAERWAVVVALSRFGSFANLQQTHSSATDVYPDTATFSFYGSTYLSSYLAFVPVERYTNVPSGSSYTPLQTLTPAEQALVNQFDTTGSIPLLDLGNRAALTGASFSPLLLAGRSLAAIAASVISPAGQPGRAIDGTANWITAGICQLTDGQPAQVCDLPAITALESG